LKKKKKDIVTKNLNGAIDARNKARKDKVGSFDLFGGHKAWQARKSDLVVGGNGKIKPYAVWETRRVEKKKKNGETRTVAKPIKDKKTGSKIEIPGGLLTKEVFTKEDFEDLKEGIKNGFDFKRENSRELTAITIIEGMRSQSSLKDFARILNEAIDHKEFIRLIREVPYTLSKDAPLSNRKPSPIGGAEAQRKHRMAAPNGEYTDTDEDEVKILIQVFEAKYYKQYKTRVKSK